MIDGTGQIIVVAGATGDLGQRLTRQLVRRGAEVRALLRKGTPEAKASMLSAAGATPVELDFEDADALKRACSDAACVVSTLNGVEDTMIDLQSRVLEGAVAAGVPRFMPSDFSLDFTKTRPGDNRNMDLRRAFAARADQAPIQVQSVLNGMFMELLAGQAPVILYQRRRVLAWGNVDQPLDFTTKDDVADFTADVALDPQAPRYSRAAGDSVSARQLAEIMSRLSGETYRTLRPGGLGLFGLLITFVRTLTPKTSEPFPAWQGMQYMRDMMSGRGKLSPLDSNRYGKTDWTTTTDFLAEHARKA